MFLPADVQVDYVCKVIDQKNLLQQMQDDLRCAISSPLTEEQRKVVDRLCVGRTIYNSPTGKQAVARLRNTRAEKRRWLRRPLCTQICPTAS